MIDKPVVIITGASQGIGRALAEKFAKEGYAAALAARNKAGLEETARLIESGGGFSPLIVPTDVRDPAQLQALVDSTLAAWGRIDVLINNAGIMHLKPFLEITPAEFQEMLDVNVNAVFELTRKTLPAMLAQRSGTVVNIASLAGKNGFKTGTGYTATKFALRGFAASLMLEVRDQGIRVVTVFPGSVDTRMITRNPNAPSKESMLQPEDVAHAVYAAVSADPRAMISEIDIRPSNPKRT